MNRYLRLTIYCCLMFSVVSAQDQRPVQDTAVQKPDTAVRRDTAIQRKRTQPRVVSVIRDSIPPKDSLHPSVDSLTQKPVVPMLPVDFSNTPYREAIVQHPWYNFSGKAITRNSPLYQSKGKDSLFYLLAGLTFLLGIIRAGFSRYFQNLFTVFFRASLKQKQIREQLLQAPLASLLLNLFFIGVSGIFATFILKDKLKNTGGPSHFWMLYAYSLAALTLLYLGKYFILKTLGWVLRMEESTDTYIFIVFMCNKVMAIFLLPLLWIMAFGNADLATVAMTVAIVVVTVVFLYRYLTAYGYINREVRTSRFHFFLYLCAFEVAPLLLIYKVLLKFV